MCHPDRSEAEWRDLLSQLFPPDQSQNVYAANFRLRTLEHFRACSRITGNLEVIDPVVAKLPSPPYHPSFCPPQPHNSPQSIHVLRTKNGFASLGKSQY